MKKSATKIIFAIVLVVGIFTLTGCGKKKAETKKEETKASSKFKNPKAIKLESDKGTVEVTYEDDGSIEESSAGSDQILKNADQNFRIFFEYGKKDVESQEKQKENYKKSESYDVIEDVKFGGYEGFAAVDKKYGTTQVFLYLDKENNVILVAKVSPVQSAKAAEAVESAKSAADVLYNLDDVQEILETITYKK